MTRAVGLSTNLRPNPHTLGAAVKSVGRACGESLVSGVRSQTSLRPSRIPHRRPGPVGPWSGRPVEQQAQRGVSSARGNR